MGLQVGRGDREATSSAGLHYQQDAVLWDILLVQQL